MAGFVDYAAFFPGELQYVCTAIRPGKCLFSSDSVRHGLVSGEVSGTKVKFSRTRYRALGPELIPVYRQSARK